MFKDNGIKFYTSKVDSDKVEIYQNIEVMNVLREKYPYFEVAYIPDKYDIAFLLEKEDQNDSFKDIWKIVFFKKVFNMPGFGEGTITLDNMDALKSSGSKYEVYKELEGSFEDVIKVSCDLISKHRGGIEKEISNETKESI